MGFARMYLRKGVIRNSVGIFKCDNITGQRRGITWNASTQHAISKLYFCKLYYSPGHCEKILHLLCVYSRRSPGSSDWHRKWRAAAAATELTSSPVLFPNATRSWGFIKANCTLQDCTVLVSPALLVHFCYI